jgi:hypothetical protein
MAREWWVGGVDFCSAYLPDVALWPWSRSNL